MNKTYCDVCEKEIDFLEQETRTIRTTGKDIIWQFSINVRQIIKGDYDTYNDKPDLCTPCFNLTLDAAYQEHVTEIKELREQKRKGFSVSEA